MAQKLDAGPAMLPPTPVPPEKRRFPDHKGMQKHTDLAWLCCGSAIPLALLAERTGTTTANAGSIHHAQAPVGFSALLMREQRLVCRAPKRSIGLENKVLAREATGLPC